MLVLTRRVGETVVIDGNIEVTVVAVQGDRVRLGIRAPKSVPVDRQEVHQRRQASASGPRLTGLLDLPRRAEGRGQVAAGSDSTPEGALGALLRKGAAALRQAAQRE